MSKLQSKTNYIIVENSPDKIQVWKSSKSHNSKSIMPKVMVLVHCTSPQWDLSAYETFWVMLRTKKGLTAWLTDGRTGRQVDYYGGLKTGINNNGSVKLAVT